MSNVYSGERTVPTILLIIFIVLILVLGISAYVIYTEQSRFEKDLEKMHLEAENAQKGLANAVKARDELFDATGFKTLDEIKDTFASSVVPVDPQKLESLLTVKFEKRAALIKEIGVEPKALDESNPSKYLEPTLGAARRAGVVPDELKNTAVGNLVEQYIRLDKATAALADQVAQGEKAVEAVDKSIAEKKTETMTKFGDLDGQAKEAWATRVVEMNRLREEKPKWDAELLTLKNTADVEKAVNDKLEQRLKDQKNMGTPLDGVILTYDWRERRGTINLGAASRVKPGYEFDVYTIRPGGDTAENRVYRGKIRLLNVLSDASLFTVIPSDWESEDRPIMEGQRVSSQLYDNVQRKIFCLKGWFPEGGDHSKLALEGMIFRAGGVIQNDLTLDTDFLVVGTISEEGLTDLSPQAKAAIAEGAKAYEQARHFYVTVLTVDKVFKYWDNAGSKTER